MPKAKSNKRAKDLSAKPKAKKVKGGGLSDDRDHLNRDVGRAHKLAKDDVVRPATRVTRATRDVTRG